MRYLNALFIQSNDFVYIRDRLEESELKFPDFENKNRWILRASRFQETQTIPGNYR